MKRLKLIVVSALVGVIAVVMGTLPSSQARWSNNDLNRVLSQYANRAVVVDCATIEEDSGLVDAWGFVFVPPGQQKQTTLDDRICVGALAIRNDVEEVSDFFKAQGAATLLHEALHLRRIRGNRNEALTECRAMRRYDGVLKALGATQAVVDRLMPIMLLDHMYLRAWNQNYNQSGCKLPKRYDKYRGYPPEV